MEKKPSSNYIKHTRKDPITKWAIGKFNELLYSYVNKIKPKKILDVGCGEGFTLKYLTKKGKFSLHGIDSSKEAIRLARKIAPKSRLRVGDVTKLPFKGNSFDIVLLLEILEHLENPKKIIKEVKRLAKKAVIISVPREPYFRIIEVIINPIIGGLPSGHINFWNSKKFEKLISEEFKKYEIARTTIWQMALCYIK